jgi:hypothetical protein
VYVPAWAGVKVRVGDRTKAGETVLATLEKAHVPEVGPAGA